MATASRGGGEPPTGYLCTNTLTFEGCQNHFSHVGSESKEGVCVSVCDVLVQVNSAFIQHLHINLKL